MDSPSPDPAQAVQRKQQLDAEQLFQRLEQLQVADLTVNYTLEQSSVIIPAVLIRFLVLAVLFRLNSAKKWHAVLDKQLLPEPLRRWLEIEGLAGLTEQATVDWIPPTVLLDTLSWQVIECLTHCGMPQPVAVIRQTIRDLLFRDAEICDGGIVVSRRFWRRFAKQGSRPLSAGQLCECQQRIDFVLGEVDLSEVVEGRWLEIPELSQEERAKLEAARVAEPCERLQALAEAFEAGTLRFCHPAAGVFLQPLWPSAASSAVAVEGLAGDAVGGKLVAGRLSARRRRFAAVAIVSASHESSAVALGAADQGICQRTDGSGDRLPGALAPVSADPG